MYLMTLDCNIVFLTKALLRHQESFVNEGGLLSYHHISGFQWTTVLKELFVSFIASNVKMIWDVLGVWTVSMELSL